MIVWLASYPRSGNTYFRMLLHHAYDVKTYSLYNDALFDREGISEIVGQQALPGTLSELSHSRELFFVKTHELPTDSNPAIYIVRDGREALISHARYRLSFGKGPKSWLGHLRHRLLEINGFEGTLKNLIVSEVEYGGWSRNVLSWASRRNGAVTFPVYYQDLIRDPAYWLGKALNGLEIDLATTGGTPPSFMELHKRWPKFFRRGESGSWHEEMPESLHRLFWESHSEAMRAFRYKE